MIIIVAFITFKMKSIIINNQQYIVEKRLFNLYLEFMISKNLFTIFISLIQIIQSLMKNCSHWFGLINDF